jgi:4-amino-4-deoxychorismate lyase
MTGPDGMQPRVLVNGEPRTSIEAGDRGLAYGDGVFETLLLAAGEPVWWDGHLARLQRGCAALGIECPAADQLREESAHLARGTARAVLKITVTRGVSTRGYAAAPDLAPTRIVSVSAGAPVAAAQAERGIRARWCETTLALQPRLAGIKHLNRLEQVLARREWDDPEIAEGLVCDTAGRAISATAANLFLVRAGRLCTPALTHSGVEGICRAWVLQQAPVEITHIERETVQRADELFLCSSLRGILPVARLDGHRYAPGPMTRQLQHALWQAVPALRPDSGVNA